MPRSPAHDSSTKNTATFVMPAYNFQPQFAALVESGQKRQTIRQTDKGAKPGATAYLYTGMRTKGCRKLGEGTITDVLPIQIGRNGCGEPYATIVGPDGVSRWVVHDDLAALAAADGFSNAAEMTQWFDRQYGLPFAGYLHQWELRAPAQA